MYKKSTSRYPKPPQTTFEEGFLQLGLRFFRPHEFLVLGSGNQGGRCAGLNTPPPRRLWPRIYHVATIWDLVRERLGEPVTTLSVYRNPEYNKCIGGVARSQHMLGTAADCTSARASAREIYDVALGLRRQGVFEGGLGLYVRSNFVHLDVRGTPATWRGN